MKHILMIISIITLQCCWGPKEFQLMKQEDNTIILKELNGTYQISNLETENVSSYNLNITFNDSAKQVSGFSGCNRFFCSYVIEKNTIKFGDIGSTKMMCDEKLNTIEAKFLKTLNDANIILFKKDGGFSIFNKKKLLLIATKETSYHNIELEYTASSRGIYKQIILTKKTISTITKRGATPTQKNCNENDWNSIKNLLESVNLETIPKLKAPSKAFQFDGAALANLKITLGDKIYESAPFDHGNPPKEIAELVKEILSISENIE